MLNTPNGKNFFITGPSFFPVGARLMGPVIPHPIVEEEGGTIFVPVTPSAAVSTIGVLSTGPGTILSTGPGQVLETGATLTFGGVLVFTRPDGTFFQRSSPDVYVGQVKVPQSFNGIPFNILSTFYAVYTFAVNDLNQGGIWHVGVLNANGSLSSNNPFLVRGFVLAQPIPVPPSIPVLSTGPGTILDTGGGAPLQTGPAT